MDLFCSGITRKKTIAKAIVFFQLNPPLAEEIHLRWMKSLRDEIPLRGNGGGGFNLPEAARLRFHLRRNAEDFIRARSDFIVATPRFHSFPLDLPATLWYNENRKAASPPSTRQRREENEIIQSRNNFATHLLSSMFNRHNMYAFVYCILPHTIWRILLQDRSCSNNCLNF